MPFQITWSRRERVKWKRERLKEKGEKGVQGMRDEEEERERDMDCWRDCKQFVKLCK